MQRKLQSKHFLIILLIIVWLCIVSWRESTHAQQRQFENIPEPLSATTQSFIQASDQEFVYRLLLIWLQQFDVQSGHYISYRELNYENLTAWLTVLEQMSPQSHYPMLLATRIYTKVADQQRLRKMLNFIYQQYQINPEKNWRWLAEATVQARHQLQDLQLALGFAETLAKAPEEEIPYWVRDMRLTILEDMGEFEQVKLLVGGLLANKAISDPNEIRFLNILLQRLQKNNN